MCFDNVYVVRAMGINSAITQNSNLLGNLDCISIYDGGGQLSGPIGRLFAHINNAFLTFFQIPHDAKPQSLI